MARLLVTGGAGYIGSHTVRQILQAGHQVVVLDDLVFGHRAALPTELEFVEGKVGDKELLWKIFSEHKFEAVLHFAAWAFVGESVKDPLKYYRNNTADALTLLETMQNYQCQTIVFSSTCATYGNPEFLPMSEAHPQNPINPYGRSKLVVEQMLRDCGSAWGLKSASLRYFNACGAASDGTLGEDHDPETHLIPLALMAVQRSKPALQIFGDDYPTADGTCIRDYIHVEDLARAHVAAVEKLIGSPPGTVLSLNLGTGVGVSVRQILDAIERITGLPVPHTIGPRREGDPAELVGDPTLAGEILGWRTQHDYLSAVRSAWSWMQGPKEGRF